MYQLSTVSFYRQCTVGNVTSRTLKCTAVMIKLQNAFIAQYCNMSAGWEKHTMDVLSNDIVDVLLNNDIVHVLCASIIILSVQYIQQHTMKHT